MTQPGETLETVAIWSAVGFVFTIVCYLIRMRFSWFLINPVMIPTSLALMDWAWLNALIALVIKIISARVVGTTKVERYVVPAASGLVFGFSILLLPMMIINFFGVALPNFYSKFVP